VSEQQCSECGRTITPPIELISSATLEFDPTGTNLGTAWRASATMIAVRARPISLLTGPFRQSLLKTATTSLELTYNGRAGEYLLFSNDFQYPQWQQFLLLTSNLSKTARSFT